ncbi:MAG: S1C family serine protease [Flavobacteriales bacterium]
MQTFPQGRMLLLFLLALPVFLNSCITLFKTQRQNDVKITTNNDTKIAVKKKEDTAKGSLTVDLKRQNYPYQVVLLKDGYKDAYRVVYSDKVGAGTVTGLTLDILTIWTLFPLWDFGGAMKPKWYDYRTPYSLEPPKVKIPEKKESQRYLVHQNTSVKLGKDDTSVVEYEDPEAYKNGEAPEDVEFRTDSVQGENILNDSIINDLLVTIGYQDTAEEGDDIVLNDYNSIDLTSEIQRFMIREYGNRGNYMNIELTVEWKLKDNYGQPIYDTTIATVSGDVSQDVGSFVELTQRERYRLDKSTRLYPIQVAVKDAIKHSLIKLVRGDEVRKILKKGGKEVEKKAMKDLQPIKIEKPPLPEKGSMNEQIKGVVTIKRKKGHGSGCIISKDGYMLTNYHVVSGKDSVKVLFDPKTSKYGEVKRKSKVLDLALLKVDTSALNPLRIQEKKSISIGSEVMAIGTPQNIQLGQSVSKGIVSGKRKFNKVNYIQTDVSINSGNSGGALIERSSGKMMGIVTAKMFGIGVEGIGFAVPAHKALEKLKIDYKE